MNKYKKILYLLAVFLCFFSFNFYTAFADDDGYYIKNMDVKVDANDKREFKIKETIDVYFILISSVFCVSGSFASVLTICNIYIF